MSFTYIFCVEGIDVDSGEYILLSQQITEENYLLLFQQIKEVNYHLVLIQAKFSAVLFKRMNRKTCHIYNIKIKVYMSSKIYTSYDSLEFT